MNINSRKSVSCLALVIGFIVHSLDLHKCVHNEILKKMSEEKSPKLQQKDEDGQNYSQPHERLLQSASFRPLKVFLDFTNVSTKDPIKKSFIVDVLSKELVRRLESFIQVTGPTVIPQFSKTDCENLSPTPSTFSKQSTTADLILIVGTISEDSSYVAYAAPCLYGNSNNRPLVGIISINLNHLEVYKDKIQNFVSMMLHEVMHVLVLSPNLYDSFPIGKNNTYKIESRKTLLGTTDVYKLITPGLVSAGKAHYGCTSFTGMYLENEGSEASAGSHFEKVLAGNEIMTAQATGRMILSFWILNLLNDCGWYKIDFTQAEKLNWGLNEGCGFLSASCDLKYSEFCTTENKMRCSPDFLSKNICIKTSFSDSCLLNEYVSEFNCNTDYVTSESASFESFGKNSRCLEVKNDGVASVGCYKVACAGQNLNITVSNTTLTCSQTGQTVNQNGLIITCPDITKFCSSFNAQCANDCSGVGKCLTSSTCYCDYFSSGNDCATAQVCSLGADICKAINAVSSESSTTVSTTTKTIKKAQILSATLLFLVFSLN
jgi:hypothetical protein